MFFFYTAGGKKKLLLTIIVFDPNLRMHHLVHFMIKMFLSRDVELVTQYPTTEHGKNSSKFDRIQL